MTMHKKKILNSNPLLFLSMLCIVIIVFLTCSVNVRAEGNPTHTYTLPYNIDDYLDNQTLFEGIGVKVLEDYTNYVSTNNYNWNLDPNNMLVVPMDFNSGKVRLYVCSSPTIADTSNISSIYSSRVRVTFSGDYNSFIFTYNMDSNGITDLWSISRQASGWYFDMFGGASVQQYQNTGLTYQFLYPVDISNDLYDINDNLVVNKYRGYVDEEEVFEDLNQFLDITSTISNGIDDTISDLQNQKGFFDNLISNLKNFFNSLKNWIYSGFSTLMGNIKNFFGPLLRNIFNKINIFLESFEDFKDKCNYFFEMINSLYNMGLDNNEFSLTKLITALLVPEVDDMVSTLNQHSIGVFIVGTLTICGNGITYVTNWLNTPAVKVFHIPTFTFGGNTYSGMVFDFGWYDNYKSYGDAIISFFLVINYVFFLYRFLPRFFRSAGSGFSDFEDLPIQQGVDHRIPF